MNLDQLYALRPISVQRRFGGAHAVLLFSGTDLCAAATEAGVAVADFVLDRVELLPGVVRAAEELDVALQVSLGSFFQAGAPDPARVTTNVVAAISAARYSGPLALATYVDAVVNGMALAQVLERTWQLIDAGITAFKFAMPLTAQELADTVAVMKLVQEHGQGVELVELPLGSAPRGLELFRRSKVHLSALSEVDDDVTLFVSGQKLVSGRRACRITLRREAFLMLIARSLDIEPDEALFTPIDAITAARVEALAFAEARLEMRRAKLIGSGSSCLASMQWPES